MGQQTRKLSQEKQHALRHLFDEAGIDGYLVPKANAHQLEYLRPEDERLSWLTQFTGSAGFCIVLKDRAVLFVDGRYTLQAPREVDTACFEIVNTSVESITCWLEKHIPRNCRLGFDPWLLTIDHHTQYQRSIDRHKVDLIPLKSNLIDRLWHDRPKTVMHEIICHPLNVSGQDTSDKLKKVYQKIQDQGADLAFMNSLESIHWLFNIRSPDALYVPVADAFALIEPHNHNVLLTNLDQIAPDVKSYLKGHCTLISYASLEDVVKSKAQQGLKFLIDCHVVPFKIKDIIEKAGGEIVFAQDPTLLDKACKTTTELQGMAAAHRRDGAALTQFLAWITESVASGAVLDEWQAAQKLRYFRQQMPHYRGESFPTISASGANGAIVHYHAQQHQARPLEKNDVYLIDSGAHYNDGSTDVTRTLILGDATPEQKDRFTRVLKGHIALARLVYPQGTNGGQIDVLARQFLWQVGLDYNHGTGHGVGSVLNIHEGPQGISKYASRVSLELGMVLSNEPGYYNEDHYGIRIESLMYVKKCDIATAEQAMLQFETLTLAPIDRHLIDLSLLSSDDVIWLNQYHARVFQELKPWVDEKTYAWLWQATAAL